MFDPEQHTAANYGTQGMYYISIDYGTVNPTAMGLWMVQNGTADMVKE